MRSTPLAVPAFLAVTLALAAAGVAAGSPKKPTTKTRLSTNSCAKCVERRPVLDGREFRDATVYEPDAPRAYAVAQKIPATIDRLHCFCECAENPKLRHKTLLTCFTDNHAAGCGICTREALMAWDLKQKGASDQEVENVVESMFRTEGHPPTHGNR